MDAAIAGMLVLGLAPALLYWINVFSIAGRPDSTRRSTCVRLDPGAQ